MNLKQTVTLRIKPYIQPFEREIAIKELHQLSGAKPILEEGGTTCKVEISIAPRLLADRLVYWEGVECKSFIYTRQVLLESTVNAVRNGIPPKRLTEIMPFKSDPPLSNRRCLRYGTHGLHEYRGKYFPQLVSALINASGIQQGSIVADPMSGSGTTAVESINGGFNAIGMDMNPLSVFMANVKCSALHYDANSLIGDYEELRNVLLDYKPRDDNWPINYVDQLNRDDVKYLKSWFSRPILKEIDFIRSQVNRLVRDSHRDFFLLSLSNILRKVSFQKESDLRVRREEKLEEDLEPIREFLQTVGRSVRLTVAFLSQNRGSRIGQHDIIDGSAVRIPNEWSHYKSAVDLIVTSPPYATALPYLDTDRLSLSYFGLLNRGQIRHHNSEMVGNREINESQRLSILDAFLSRSSDFPESIVQLIRRVDRLNNSVDVGFRRKNMSALLCKYFTDMREVFVGMKFVLKRHRQANVVVGVNRTNAGGEDIVINTPDLLLELAESLGFAAMPSIEMDMLKCRDIHKENSIPAERILRFKKK